MPFLVHSFVSPITQWSATGIDGFGVRTYSPPALVYGRWEDLIQVTIDITLERVKSRTSAYFPVDAEIQYGDYLALGDYTQYGGNYIIDPKDLENAFFVVNVRTITTPRGFMGVKQVLFSEARL